MDAGSIAARTRPAVARDTSQENWRLLQYFNFYRLVIALLASGMAIAVGEVSPFGSSNPRLFLYASIVYLIVALFGIQITRQRDPDFETQATVFAFCDVAFITFLMHASGGLSSGLGLFLVVTVIGTSLMLGRRMTLFIAAIAAIAALLEHSWVWLTVDQTLGHEVLEGLPMVGMLGIVLFGAAFFGNYMAHRLRRTEALAERRGVDLVNLAQINELIIKRMQSGVLLCNAGGHIGLINEQAQRFLGLEHFEQGGRSRPSVKQLAPELGAALEEWLQRPNRQLRKPVRTRRGQVLLPRFVAIGAESSGLLIFLDDVAALKQQAQQLKMAALARLTASIAHEIRNPLGAMANAAQLLGESVADRSEEGRLVRIIVDHSKRMNTIIENITQLARRDRVSQVRLPLHTWLKEFVEQYTEFAHIPKGAIHLDPGPDVLEACVDPDQLYQVVINLCQNALRHCPEYTDTPLVRLELRATEMGQPTLDVADIGPGVPPEIRDNIFDPFFTTTPKGTGLGLYIARELCEGNGGGLEYIPSNTGGARFRITFATSDECSETAIV